MEEAQVGVAASLATLDVLKVIVFALEFGGNVEWRVQVCETVERGSYLMGVFR